MSEINFEEEFQIGFRDVSEYELIVKPVMVKTGLEGNIFIADEKMKRIQVYNQSGAYLRTIGSQGKGPGEFEGTPNFTIDRTGNLIVMDNRNRRISLFNYTGEEKYTFQPNQQSMIWANSFQNFQDESFLLLRKLPEYPFDVETHRKSILHVFNSTFDERKISFANYDELIDNRSEFVEYYITNLNPGNIWIENDNIVWYVPGIYEGNIYKFEQLGGQWIIGQVLKGTVLQEQAVQNPSDNDNENQITTFYVFSGDGPYSGKIISESLGLFSMNDETVVHFSSQINGDERVFLVECFDQNGSLFKTGQIKDFNILADTRRTKFGDIWKDEDDRFYIIDERHDTLVRVGKLNCLQ